MVTRPFQFSGSTGKQLSGRMELPDGRVRGWAVFAHCFTCGKDNRAAVRIARLLARQGIGVLRFDFAGLGESEGDFADSRFSYDVQDLQAAARALAADDKAPSLLIGHSLGGAAAIAAASSLPSIRGVATVNAPFDVAHTLHQFDPAALAVIDAEGAADVRLAGRPFRVGKGLIDDLRGQDQGARIAALRRPLLVMHAPLDDTVGIENATKIYVAARHPKSFVSLDDADHLLSRPQDVERVGTMIAAWATPYLTAPIHPPAPTVDAEAEETGDGKFQVAITAGDHVFLADEPASVGGLGSGPSPFDLLSAALAACTTMTLRLYADGKSLPVTRIRTVVGHQKEVSNPQPDLFNVRVSIEGAIDDSQRARMMEIAERCPVHRTLERGARFAMAEGEPPAPCEPPEAHMEAMDRATGDRCAGP
ncbi:alpha/beta fold hydrolase [Sphingopyxis sp.]|uniref:bifunctional alpha/beta hydrolase/OsmC family protein n=1 Tax=Sphingopyxis sp. TaxID=1908224 RepID=UPI003BADB29B